MPAAGYPFHGCEVAGLDRRNPLKAARAAAAGPARDRSCAPHAARDAAPTSCSAAAATSPAPAGLAARSLRLPLVLTEADSHLGDRQPAARAARRAGLPAFPICRAATGRSGWSRAGRSRPALADADRARRPRPVRHRRRARVPARVRRLARRAAPERGARSRRSARRARAGSCTPAAGATTPTCARRLERARRPAALQAARLHHAVRRRATRPPTWRRRARAGRCSSCSRRGFPAILVPYPHATADHQTENARWVERGGAAVVVPDDELDGPRLAREVGGAAGVVRAASDNAARGPRLARPDAAERIAHEILMLRLQVIWAYGVPK